MRGFTLVEIIVVLAIVTTLAAIGLTVGIDSYQRFLFRSDLHTAASLLQKARSSAINNIGETSHGVYFDNAGRDFVLFRGLSYATRNVSFDLPVEKSKTVTLTGPSEVVFSPLSGTTTGGTLTLADGVINATIQINNEGGINW